MVVVNDIVNACIELYKEFPDKLKPNKDEWTVMSAVVGVFEEKHIKVLSFGTGSKCIGRSMLSEKGDVLNDSHAEVIARRAFLKYLYNEMLFYNETCTSDVLYRKDILFIVKDSVKFYFVTSMLPCGDAAIMPKSDISITDLELTYGSVQKRKLSDENCDTKRMKLEFSKISSDILDIHRTGAKCLPESLIQDPHLPGVSYHNIGAVRTKPGRGDPTLSLSCSDKIAKWTSIGWQGALLSLLLEKPITVDAIICGGGSPFSQESFNRAINERTNRDNFTPIHQSAVIFPNIKTSKRKPSPVCLIWSRTRRGGDLEVAVNGRKQGVTKKNLNKKVARTSICKKELFLLFGLVVNTLPEKEKFLENILGEDGATHLNEKLRYGQVKSMAKEYQSMWKSIRDGCFKVWSRKPVELLNFTLEDDSA
ncbi:hypothetical protein RUM43_014038 [Polyplax serrata]|uniref:tRNA-specific adenosine deaminase 1 n=1 Tax=Polyplax serrata TaxID=468196 RepID=A0AAN8P088_POLSC